MNSQCNFIYSLTSFALLHYRHKRAFIALKSPLPYITYIITPTKGINEQLPTRQAATLDSSGIDLMILGALV